MKDCVPCLRLLIEDDPIPAAIIIDGKISYFNQHFVQIFQTRPEKLYQNSPESLAPGMGIQRLVTAALTTQKAQVMDGQIILPNSRKVALWLQTSILGSGRDAVRLRAVDMSAQRRMEISILDDMRKSYGDSVYVLNEAYDLTYMRAEPKIEAQVRKYGRRSMVIFVEDSRDDLRLALIQAKSVPGKTISITLRLRKQVRPNPVVYVDIMYMHGAFAGGHYFICTRPQKIDVQGVLDRLRIAHNVTTDAALAVALGVSPPNVSSVRHGDKLPSDWVVRTHYERHVSSDWILSGIGSKKGARYECADLM